MTNTSGQKWFHFSSSWVLLETRLPRHLCLWESCSPIVWRNSRWGCRSATLQKIRAPILNTIFMSLSFFFTVFLVCFFSSRWSPWTQYLWIGKTNMERGVDRHIKCQGLVRKPLNLHHYSAFSGEMVGLIQTISTQLEERRGLSSAEK